jgi:hypothetical protein
MRFFGLEIRLTGIQGKITALIDFRVTSMYIPVSVSV